MIDITLIQLLCFSCFNGCVIWKDACLQVVTSEDTRLVWGDKNQHDVLPDDKNQHWCSSFSSFSWSEAAKSLLENLCNCFLSTNHYHNKQSIHIIIYMFIVYMYDQLATVNFVIRFRYCLHAVYFWKYMNTYLFWSETVFSFQLYTSSRCAHIDILILTLISGCGYLMMSCTICLIRTCLNII